MEHGLDPTLTLLTEASPEVDEITRIIARWPRPLCKVLLAIVKKMDQKVPKKIRGWDE